jgi:predicted dehydrogenase
LPHIQKLSQIFATKDLGKLRRFEIFLGHGGSPRDQDSWKMDINRVGGGALLDPGSHCLDLALLYFPNLLEMEARKISTSGFWANKFPEDEITYFFNKEVYIKVHASLIQWRSTFSVEALGEEGYVRLTGRDRSYGNPTFSIGLRWNWHTKGKSQDDTEEHFIFPYENSVQSELLAVLGISTSFINPPATLEDAIQIIYLIESLNS